MSERIFEAPSDQKRTEQQLLDIALSCESEADLYAMLCVTSTKIGKEWVELHQLLQNKLRERCLKYIERMRKVEAEEAEGK